MSDTKQSFVVRMRPEAKIEEQPIVVTLKLTDEQKKLVAQITGKDVSQINLTAIELNQVVDAVAFEHGSTIGASY
jgi:hypothetical protein